MKRLLSLVLCLVLLFSLSGSVFATAGSGTVVSVRQYTLENGMTVNEETVIHPGTTRSLGRTATTTRVYSQDDVVIAVIAITGQFLCDGSTVRVGSKSISRLETYEGYSFVQEDFTVTGSGNEAVNYMTIRLTGTLRKSIFDSSSVDISLTCDNNGNLS